ncbi:MAG: CxxxxCH/CxxCH domain-containing protein, partial [Desulfuromonadales bacterium]|nr:CxxxxCH/CxxCH domain-containing protein [Desulfuromonadales bacterium]
MKSCLGVLSVVALLLFSGYGTVEAAVKAHPGSCNACHRLNGANPRAVNSLCLTCHVSTGLAQAAGAFSTAATSNAFNNNPSAGTGAGSQSSHFWGGSKTAMPEAGSQNPPTAFYSSRNSISTGLMTCSMCHDPHGNKDTTIKQLRTTTATTTDIDNTVCKQCHVAYFVNNDYAMMTHPVGPMAVLPAVNNPLKFKAGAPVNVNQGTIQLVSGSISCSSCHGTHYTDSDSRTVDGKGQALNAGDGNLLRTDGTQVSGSTAQETAERRSAVCTACHPYKTHGQTNPIGCLSCHGAHVYNASGPANIYVLRNNLFDKAGNPVTGATFTSIGTPATRWADGDPGTATGYCEKCHGSLTQASGISAVRLHSEGEDCATCHVHNKADAVRSFEATACDSCHGYPPATNAPTTGYAVNSAKGYNYLNDPDFKDESATPHPTHSGTSSSYKFSCASCHNADFASTHDKGTFQDVFTGSTFQEAVKPVGSGLTPTYVKTGNGTCSATACHSNGGKRTGDATYVYTTTTPTWTGTKGTITTCDACHGNSVATMTSKNNSTSHLAHLTAGYACNICHATTADSNTALAAGAAGTTHVNGAKNISFTGV